MILILLVGIAFYTLAWIHQKNKLKYTAIGIGTAFAAQFVAGMIYYILFRPTKEEMEESDMMVNIIAFVFSLIVVAIIYTKIKNKFEKNVEEIDDTRNNFEEIR